MDRIDRNGVGGLALRAVVIGVCLLAGCIRSTAPLAMADAEHRAHVSRAA